MSFQPTLMNDRFSKNLFWDVDVSTIDMDNNKRFIIQRVLEYGVHSDWDLIKNYYGLDTIVREMRKVRNLERISLSFISAIADIPLTKFRCYTLKPSKIQHWNF